MICDFNLALSITGILKNNFDTNFIGLFINYPFPNLENFKLMHFSSEIIDSVIFLFFSYKFCVN